MNVAKSTKHLDWLATKIPSNAAAVAEVAAVATNLKVPMQEIALDTCDGRRDTSCFFLLGNLSKTGDSGDFGDSLENAEDFRRQSDLTSGDAGDLLARGEVVR